MYKISQVSSFFHISLVLFYEYNISFETPYLSLIHFNYKSVALFASYMKLSLKACTLNPISPGCLLPIFPDG